MNFILTAQIKDVFIDSNTGNDLNVGSKEQPLKTLYEAASRVNKANGTGAISIYLSEGIYGLDATVTFHPVNWHFSKDQRLTIRAAILPDDSDWNPGKMPVIVSTMEGWRPKEFEMTKEDLLDYNLIYRYYPSFVELLI